MRSRCLGQGVRLISQDPSSNPGSASLLPHKAHASQALAHLAGPQEAAVPWSCLHPCWLNSFSKKLRGPSFLSLLFWAFLRPPRQDLSRSPSPDGRADCFLLFSLSPIDLFHPTIAKRGAWCSSQATFQDCVHGHSPASLSGPQRNQGA